MHFQCITDNPAVSMTFVICVLSISSFGHASNKKLRVTNVLTEL